MGTKAHPPKVDAALLVAALLWVPLWGLARAAQRGWFPGDLFLIPCALAAVGVVILSASVMWLIARLTSRRAVLKPAVAAVAVLAAYTVALAIPWMPSSVFRRNQDKFVMLADQAQQRYLSDRHYEFPPSFLYRNASVYTDAESGATVAEFVVRDFYLPLVFVSTGRPEDAYDTCSSGGRPIEQLAPNWYLCKRDWN